MNHEWIQRYLDLIFDPNHVGLTTEQLAEQIGCDVEWLEHLNNDDRYWVIMERARHKILEHMPRMLAALLEKGLKGDATVVRLLWMMSKPETQKGKKAIENDLDYLV
ncbi:MAG: hypothetical protein N2450_05075 [bacterium]|nr:hypothetical protein [bacterium]